MNAKNQTTKADQLDRTKKDSEESNSVLRHKTSIISDLDKDVEELIDYVINELDNEANAQGLPKEIQEWAKTKLTTKLIHWSERLVVSAKIEELKRAKRQSYITKPFMWKVNVRIGNLEKQLKDLENHDE